MEMFSVRASFTGEEDRKVMLGERVRMWSMWGVEGGPYRWSEAGGVGGIVGRGLQGVVFDDAGYG